jgi:ubiquitin-protein ligase E3 C
MKEVKVEDSSNVSPLIRSRLEKLYDSVRINNLLSRLMQLGTSSATDNGQVIQSISSFFNTLMLKLPGKKDIILNNFLYKSSNTKHLLKILWNTWSESNEAKLFKNNQDIMSNLSEATKSITGKI